MSISIVPKLSQIFPNEKYENLYEILDGCPSEFALIIASEINSRLFQKNAFAVEEELFYQIINQKGIPNRDIINSNYLEFKNKFKNHSLAIFPLINVLRLMEYELKNYRNIDKYSNPTKELQVLKALLYINEEMDNKHAVIKTGNTFHVFWSAALNQFEFRKQKNFGTELYLSFSLFEFYKKQYPAYFENFLSLFGCKDEIQFLKDLVGLFINAWDKKNKKMQCLFPNDIEKKNQTIKPFVIDLNNYHCSEYIELSKNHPFIVLREKPIIKLSDGNFLITNWNFIIDKFRQGLLFDFYNLSGLKKDKIKFEDYKSEFGKKFSEKEVFINTLNSFFDNDDNIISKWEQNNKKWNFDYYTRIDNKILLFEFKDILMSDLVKESTGEKIEEYLHENFFETIDGQPKGITQLLNQIIELNNNPNYVENYNEYGLQISNLIVFPIIVYTDNTFSFPTINYNLSQKFKEKINNLNTNFFLIYNPTLIGMETLIKYYNYIKNNPTKIVSLLHSYSQYLAMYSDSFRKNPNTYTFLKQGISFDDFIDEKNISSEEITETYAYKEATKKLFPE